MAAGFFSTKTEDLVRNLYDCLGESRSLGVAESCTGGLVGGALTAVPGSSEYFSGGIIAYENRVKRELLGVEAGALAAEGAVSETVAGEMVEGVCSELEVDVGLSVTGIAGPGGGTENKPVGLVFAGFRVGDQRTVEKRHFSGSRADNRRKTVRFVLGRLTELL